MTPRSTVKQEVAYRASSSHAAGVSDSGLLDDLNRQITQLQVTVDGLEKERDFYFGKLRDIEVLIQSRAGESEADDGPVSSLCKEVQSILYSTEEGFEVPQENQDPSSNNMSTEEVY